MKLKSIDYYYDYFQFSDFACLSLYYILPDNKLHNIRIMKGMELDKTYAHLPLHRVVLLEDKPRNTISVNEEEGLDFTLQYTDDFSYLMHFTKEDDYHYRVNNRNHSGSTPVLTGPGHISLLPTEEELFQDMTVDGHLTVLKDMQLKLIHIRDTMINTIQ